MIAVSDAVLILVSAATLASGLYRWQNNVEQASMANPRPTVTVETRTQNNLTADAENQQIANVNGTSGNATASNNIQANEAANPQPSNNILVVEPRTTASINIANDPDTAASNSATVAPPPYGSYIVRSGDSLSEIAEQYLTTVRRLQEINQLSNTLITVGQELRYPLPAN
ncbi:MAG: LysM peptidoglycan-binding domain-containing protein [Granulosicoccus sp.]